MAGPKASDVTAGWAEPIPPLLDDVPFVGRELEMAHLGAAIERAYGGESTFLALTGEAGVGKTRLVRQAVSSAEIAVHWATCSEARQGSPYSPIGQLLRSIRLRMGSARFRESITEPLDLEDPLSVPLPQGEGGRSDLDRFRLYERVVRGLRLAADSEPLLLVIDDVQWADPSSVRLLNFMAQSLTNAAIAVIVTVRAGESPTGDTHSLQELLGGMTSLRLARFTRQQSHSFLARLADGTVDPGYVDAAYDATGGNAFFLAEWARSVRGDSGGLETRSASLESLPLNRLSRLEATVRELVEAAAVIGDSVDAELLAAVLERSDAEVSELVEVAVRHGLLASEEQGGFRLAHGLVRDAVYGDLPPRRRRELHHAVAEVLRSRTDHPAATPERVARHLREVDPARLDPDVVDRLVEAAAAADSSFARDVAVQHYTEALELLDRAGEPAATDGRAVRLRIQLARAHMALAEAGAARLVLRRAADDARASQSWELLAEVALTFPPGFEGVAMAPAADAEQVALRREALANLPEGPSSQRARLLGALATSTYWTRHLEGRPEQFDAMLGEQDRLSLEGLEMARQLGDQGTVARCLVARLNATWSPGHLEERPAMVRELFELASAMDDLDLLATALGWQILESMDAGRLREAEARVMAYSDLADRLGQPLYRRSAHQWLASIQMLRGDIAGGMAAASGALAETAALIGDENALTEVAMLMSVQHFFVGDYAALIEPARHVVATNERTSLNWQCGLAFMLAEEGELDEARALFLDLVDADHSRLPHDINWLVCTQLLALTACIVGETERGAAIYAALLPFEGRDAVHGWGYASYGPVAWALGELAMLAGDTEAAMRHLRLAVRTSETGPYRAVSELRLLQAASGIDAPDEQVGALDRLAARFRSWDMARFARECDELRSIAGEPADTAAPCHLERRPDGWRIRIAEHDYTTRSSRGMSYLAELLRRPGEALPAGELLGAISGTPTSAPVDAGLGAVIDETARRAYTTRLEELDALVARSRREDVVERAHSEARQLRLELQRSTRPGGRVRQASGSAERARVSVTKAIRRAIAQLYDDAPLVARHLDAVVQTGASCSYGPHPEATDWVVKLG